MILEHGVSFCDDFEPSIQFRPDLHDDIPLPDLEQENDLSMPLSHDIAPQISTSRMSLRMS